MSAAPIRKRSDPLKDLIHSLNCTITDMKPFTAFAVAPKGREIKADLIHLVQICENVLAGRTPWR